MSDILGLFVQTLNSDDKYSLCSWKNLLQPIQMQLFQTQKTLSEFFAAYLKSTSNFEHFGKKT